MHRPHGRRWIWDASSFGCLTWDDWGLVSTGLEQSLLLVLVLTSPSSHNVSVAPIILVSETPQTYCIYRKSGTPNLRPLVKIWALSSCFSNGRSSPLKATVARVSPAGCHCVCVCGGVGAGQREPGRDTHWEGVIPPKFQCRSPLGGRSPNCPYFGSTDGPSFLLKCHPPELHPPFLFPPSLGE